MHQLVFVMTTLLLAAQSPAFLAGAIARPSAHSIPAFRAQNQYPIEHPNALPHARPMGGLAEDGQQEDLAISPGETRSHSHSAPLQQRGAARDLRGEEDEQLVSKLIKINENERTDVRSSRIELLRSYCSSEKVQQRIQACRVFSKPDRQNTTRIMDEQTTDTGAHHSSMYFVIFLMP